MNYRLKDGSLTSNPILTWLDKSKEEIQILREAGQLPPYVEKALKQEASQNLEQSPKQPTPKKPRKKRVKKVAVAENKEADKLEK